MSGEQVETLYAFETIVEKNNNDQDWASRKNCSCYSIYPDHVEQDNASDTKSDITQNDDLEQWELNGTQEQSFIQEDLKTIYEAGSFYEVPPSELDVEMMEGGELDRTQEQSFAQEDLETMNEAGSFYEIPPSELDVEMMEDSQEVGEAESIWNLSIYSPTPSETDVELL